MRDPHVVALCYRLETAETVSFDNPRPVGGETGSFRLRLDNGKLTIELKEHFSSVDAARKPVEDYLHAWELDVALHFGRREIRFIYENAEVVDRDPPPPGSPQVIHLSGISSGEAFGTATIHISRSQYPEPPALFRISPDVETLWNRYEGYLEGREPLLSMAYFCLTVIESQAGGRKNAARMYKISDCVLSKLGELTSAKGDERTARKFKQDSIPTPLTSAEVKWIGAAIKAIIRRVGELVSTSSLATITMSDLPKL